MKSMPKFMRSTLSVHGSVVEIMVDVDCVPTRLATIEFGGVRDLDTSHKRDMLSQEPWEYMI